MNAVGSDIPSSSQLSHTHSQDLTCFPKFASHQPGPNPPPLIALANCFLAPLLCLPLPLELTTANNKDAQTKAKHKQQNKKKEQHTRHSSCASRELNALMCACVRVCVCVCVCVRVNNGTQFCSITRNRLRRLTIGSSMARFVLRLAAPLRAASSFAWDKPIQHARHTMKQVSVLFVFFCLVVWTRGLKQTNFGRGRDDHQAFLHTSSCTRLYSKLPSSPERVLEAATSRRSACSSSTGMP